MEKLPDQIKEHIVRALACFETPSDVAAEVKEAFEVEISRQAVQVYDPTKAAGRDLSEQWRLLFETTRETFLKESAALAIANRNVRLKALQRMARKAEDMKNFALAAQLLEQAAKECGDVYTNKRTNELTGLNGGPIETRDVSAREIIASRIAGIASRGAANSNTSGAERATG